MYKQYKAVVSPMGCIDGNSKVLIKYVNSQKEKLLSIEALFEEIKKNTKIRKLKNNNQGRELLVEKGQVEIWDTKVGFTPLLRVIQRNPEFNSWMQIKIQIQRQGRTISKYVNVTTDHPFETENKRLVLAKDLQIGDEIATSLKTRINTDDTTITIGNVVEISCVDNQMYSYDVTTESEHFEFNGVYSHNCRAFLSPYYERGGQEGPADENDKPVFEGRFNSGAISLNLPLIYLRSKVEGRDFFELLDERLEQIRSLHKRTRDYIGNLYASTNPLAFTQGGFYGGNLRPDQRLKESKELMESTTYSFGITALDELQKAYNGKTLTNDGEFALEVLKHINEKTSEFKKEDHMLYAIYGTPAESLCFDGDTIVQTYGGNKKIKDLTTKDLVYSFNETLKKIELKPVIRSLKTKTNAKVVKVTFDNEQEVICTPDHPFGVIVGGKIEYIEAQNLKHNNILKSNNIGNNIEKNENNHKVASVEELSETRDVYDITVEDNHNFFVGGDDGILVHNCGKQIKQLRTYVGANIPALTDAGYEIVKKGEEFVIPGVCDREYVSNSFHCNVREDITPIQKQDLENRFWNYCNGGKIQYVRYPVGYNYKAMDTLVRRAMEKGFYEGCNLALSYCDDCGHQEIDLGDECPHCGSKNLTKIDRMNGYLAFSRVKGDTRLNEAKMAEIDERKSM